MGGITIFLVSTILGPTYNNQPGPTPYLDVSLIVTKHMSSLGNIIKRVVLHKHMCSCFMIYFYVYVILIPKKKGFHFRKPSVV